MTLLLLQNSKKESYKWSKGKTFVLLKVSYNNFYNIEFWLSHRQHNGQVDLLNPYAVGSRQKRVGSEAT